MTTAYIIDPRGTPAQAPLPPAPRLQSLSGRRVLLIDNGKLLPAYGAYATLWDVLQRAYPDTSWSYFSEDLLTYGDRPAAELAPRLISEHAPDAAVLALADAGVSLPTALFAFDLEQHGVPTAVIATPLGTRVVRSVFEALAPSLEPVTIDTIRTDSAARVAELAEAALSDIAQRLTERPNGRPARGSASTPPQPAGTADWSAVCDSMHAFMDWAEEQGFGDGLPLIPPTGSAVTALLATVADDPERVIFGPALSSGRLLRVLDVAANAAMTGCPPRAFPVVLAALRAMARPSYRLNQSAITSHPSGNAIVFSGSGADTFGLSGGPGCLGPGYRGNATVGRAVSLTVQSVFGARPGAGDLSTLGSPAEFTYCFAEAIDASPWPPLAAQFGDGAPGVLVMKCEGPRNVLEHIVMHPEGLCEALAANATGLGANNAYVPRDLLVILNPEHARIFADHGWSREDVAQALHALARVPREIVDGKGILPIRPPYMRALDAYPATPSARDVHVIVAGAPGPQSMVALPWGYSVGQWEPVLA